MSDHVSVPRWPGPRPSAVRALPAGAGLLLVPAIASAHAASGGPLGWWSWSAPLDVLLPLILAAVWYAHGARHRQHRRAPGETTHVAAGLLVIVVALMSPVDPLGEASYTMHQVQHLLLRSVAPLLLFVASPIPTFAAGAPGAVRRLAGRIGGNRAWRAVFGALLHPATATVLFIATAWIWQWPAFFTAALLDPTTHNWMHFTMLGSGVLFWWRIFDDRPSAPGYGGRIVMLWAATAANVVLGAILTLKGSVAYPVYDTLSRLWLTGPADELVGGLIVWIPGSMMMLIGLLVVIRRWGERESRQEAKRIRSLAGRSSADALVAAVPGTRFGIRRQALGLGLISITILLVFVAWIGWGVVGA